MAVVPSSSRASSSSAGSTTLLSTTTLGADGTFDISSIDQTYNDLIVAVIVRGTQAAVNDNLIVRLNNDSAANYFQNLLWNSNATISNSDPGVTATPSVGLIPAASATASFFGMLELTISGYTSTTWSKVIQVRTSSQWTATNLTNYTAIAATFWNSTAAINRLGFFGQGTANLLAASTVRIYGRL